MADLSAGLAAAGAGGVCAHEACDPATMVTKHRAAAAMHGAKRSNISFSFSPAVRVAGFRGRRFLDPVARANSNTEAGAAPNFATAAITRNRTLALGPQVLI